jgi:hypothetical protein
VSLRAWLLAVVAVTLVVGGALVLSGVVGFGTWLGFNALVILLAVLLERRGYAPRAPRGAVLRRTQERFVDPTTGKLVEVWEDPATGAREYRPV